MIDLFDETQIQELLKQRKEQYENALHRMYVLTSDNVLFWIRSDGVLFTLDTTQTFNTTKLDEIEEKYDVKYVFTEYNYSKPYPQDRVLDYYHLGSYTNATKFLDVVFNNPETLIFSCSTRDQDKLVKELRNRGLRETYDDQLI